MLPLSTHGAAWHAACIVLLVPSWSFLAWHKMGTSSKGMLCAIAWYVAVRACASLQLRKNLSYPCCRLICILSTFIILNSFIFYLFNFIIFILSQLIIRESLFHHALSPRKYETLGSPASALVHSDKSRSRTRNSVFFPESVLNFVIGSEFVFADFRKSPASANENSLTRGPKFCA